MDNKNLIKYYCLDILLCLNFDILKENNSLENIIELDNIIENKKLIKYIVKNNFIKDYSINKIFNYHKNSKCVVLKNININNELILFSVTKPSNNQMESFLLNKNRLKFFPTDLSCINKENCELFYGVYGELFEYNCFKKIKNFILELDQNIIINMVGKSINGMTTIVLAYLINMVIPNKINIYSYSICKFCNQEFIEEIEKKSNININIINHKYDAVQLLVEPFTLNFKNLIIIDNELTIQNNKDKNQDDIIHNHFIKNMFYYSIKYHYTYNFFNSLLKCIEE